MDENLNILIQQCQANKREAQSQVYQKYSAQLFSVCLRYSNTYEDAQDTFQEGFIVIFKKIKQYKFNGSFEGWMRRIMVNLCMEKFRKNNHLVVVKDEFKDEEIEPNFEDEPLNEELSYNELLTIVRELPDRYQQVFNLYVIEEYSHQEIAAMLNITVGTSKSNLSRARVKLQELLKKKNNIQYLLK